MLIRRLARRVGAFRIPVTQRWVSTKTPPFPTVETCPSPTCSCAPTPKLPEGFEIDHKIAIRGLISNYAQQVLVCTGKNDWPSRIEDDNSGDNLAADLRELVGRGGVFSDVSSRSDMKLEHPVANGKFSTIVALSQHLSLEFVISIVLAPRSR